MRGLGQLREDLFELVDPDQHRFHGHETERAARIRREVGPADRPALRVEP